MQSLCVFCGSSDGASAAITAAARAFGAMLADRKITLVYGGGGRGVMGALADETLASGGTVIGVIPRDMVVREWAHGALTELRIVDTMHERKAEMARLAGAFAALPGGIGTIDEFFEIWTWSQLGLHKKPCGILNVDGYFDHLLAFVEHMVAMKFLPRENFSSLTVHSDPTALIATLMDRTAR